MKIIKKVMELLRVNRRTMAALLLLTVCMAAYAMADIGAVIFLLDQS